MYEPHTPSQPSGCILNQPSGCILAEIQNRPSVALDLEDLLEVLSSVA